MSNQDSSIHQDVATMLCKDHRNLETQLAIYSALSMIEHQKKKQLIDQMSSDLSAHLRTEEKVGYPEVKVHIKGLVSIMNQGIVEHIRLRFLLKQLKAVHSADVLCDEHIQQFSSTIGQHIVHAEVDMVQNLEQEI